MEALQHTARELGLLVRRLKGMHRAVVEEVGLRLELPAVAVLSTLEERGRLRPSALAEILALDLSSISRQVAALEREGWLSRERDPADSRASLLDLTDDGRAVLQRVRTTHLDHLRALITNWSDDDLESFAAQLQRFRLDLSQPDSTHSDVLFPDTNTPALAGREA